MPSRISFEIRAAILAHAQHGLSCRQISDQLRDLGMVASKTTINRVIKEFKEEQKGNVKPPKKLGTQNQRSVRTKAAILRVKNLVNRSHPYTQRRISRQLGLSLKTVWRIIHHDLGGKLRKKTKTHALSDKMVAQRLIKGPRLLARLRGRKLHDIVSIDEAWCYMPYVNGQRRVYYEFRGKQSPRSWRKFIRKKHPQGIMFVAGISYKGTTDIRFIPPRCKVNSEYYVNNVLDPLFKKDIPRLFGKRAKMAVLHQDSAPAHKAAKTIKWLTDHGYKFIPEADWPANSPDLSPMDYSINGIFEQRLWKRKARNLQGLKRAMKEEWKRISLDLCRRTMNGWAPRVEKMLQNRGYQFEHLKNLSGCFTI